MFPANTVDFFPSCVRGHGSRRSHFQKPNCAVPACQLHLKTRGTLPSTHTFDRTLNYAEYVKEREFGELVRDTLKKYAQQ